MTDVHPSYSHLTPDQLELALDLARRLRRAASDLSRLTDGGPAVAYIYSTGGGRAAERAAAVQQWTGPHRTRFELLVDEDLRMAATAAGRLSDEADAWARFWATATTARTSRISDEPTPPVPVPDVANGYRPLR